jgi:hypothetical protein
MKSDLYNSRRKLFSEKSVEELIDLLSDTDLATRFIAEMCLREATGT